MTLRVRACARQAAALTALAAVACGGVDSDAGTDALLRVEGAQFVRGAPAAASGGPSVADVHLVTNTFAPGSVGKSVSGALAAGSTAAVVSLAGDVGYWIVPAGVPDVATPGLPSFRAALDFSYVLAPGGHDLVVSASDGAGRVGPALVTHLEALSRVPHGHLVVSLTWDSEADLDLHVVEPDGVEIWKGNPNSYEAPAPGTPPDPAGYANGAQLDVDSNASCVIDGRRLENVAWSATPPPKGHYLVRVDTFSLCGATSARWKVEAILEGTSVASGTGIALPSDTQFDHGRGAGTLAIELDVP